MSAQTLIPSILQSEERLEVYPQARRGLLRNDGSLVRNGVAPEAAVSTIEGEKAREVRVVLVPYYANAYEGRNTTGEKVNLAEKGMDDVNADINKIGDAYKNGKLVSSTVATAVQFTANLRSGAVTTAKDALDYDIPGNKADRERKLKEAEGNYKRIHEKSVAVQTAEGEKRVLQADLRDKVDALGKKMMENPFVAADVVNAAKVFAATVIVATDTNAAYELASSGSNDLVERGFPSLFTSLGSAEAVRTYVLKALSSVNMRGEKPLSSVKASMDEHLMAGDLYPGRFGDGPTLNNELAFIDDVLAIYAEPTRASVLQRKKGIESLLGKAEAEMASSYPLDPIELYATSGDPKLLALYAYKQVLESYQNSILAEDSWNRTANNVRVMYGNSKGVAVNTNSGLLSTYEEKKYEAILVRGFRRPVESVTGSVPMSRSSLPQKNSGRRIN